MKVIAKAFILAFFFASLICNANYSKQLCIKALAQINRLGSYEAIRILGLEPIKQFSDFRAQTGIFVVTRDGSGNAEKVLIRVLVDNLNCDIRIIGDFNEWGKKLLPEHILKPVENSPYYETMFSGLVHGMQYRLLVNGQQLLDPSATLFTPLNQAGIPYLNSVFWDFERPNAYLRKNPVPDLRGEYLVIAEVEVSSLIKKWPSKNGNGPKDESESYRFIAECGVIDKLREMGYNAVRFLPFNTSVDGSNWESRYLVYGHFGPDSRWGNPDDFAYMVDTFNANGIVVIQDAVLGHYPVDHNNDVRNLWPIGLHNWKKADGSSLFGFGRTPWPSVRYDFSNPFVRRFLVDGILTMMKRFGIGGVRIDNVDGIRGYEDSSVQGGDEMLSLLGREIRSYLPQALFDGEIYLAGGRAFLRIDEGGIGFSYRNDSHMYSFFKDNTRVSTDYINTGHLEYALTVPWDWGEITNYRYLTNHDEASHPNGGLSSMYPASSLDGGGWHFVERKIKAYGLFAMLASPAYLDMPQMRILQKGSFSCNGAIEWKLLLEDESRRKVAQLFSDASFILRRESAFGLHNLRSPPLNHIDHHNKVVSILRIDWKTGKRFYAIFNMSHLDFIDYEFGVDSKALRILLNTDNIIYNGRNLLEAKVPSGIFISQDLPMHKGKRRIRIPILPSHTTILFEEIY